MRKILRFPWQIKLWSLLFLLGILATDVSFAQTQIVKGKITDETQPLIGVNVLIKGTTIGTVTDIDGNYSLEAASDAVLVFSFIGYLTEEVNINGRTQIDLVLTPDITQLSEVVVVGYGQQLKREVTGSIAQIKSEELNKFATSDFASAMQGQLAGVSVRSSSGAPGSNAVITIRGITSFSAGGSEPLYVVDGVTYTSNPNITPQEIESIEVLKDGASAAIYGTRASAGVILITTKAGKPGKLQVGLDSYYGIQNITSDIHLANTQQALYISDLENRYKTTGIFNPLVSNPDALLFDTDWLDELQVDNAAMQNYTLNVSGGKDELTFNVVGTHFSQDGSLRNSAYNKQSIRTNVNFKKEKFKAQAILGFARSNRQREPWALQFDAIKQAPYRPGFNTDLDVFTITGTNPENLGFFISKLKQESESVDYSVNGNLRLTYEIIKGLNVMANVGGSVFNADDRFFQPTLTILDEDGEFNSTASTNISTLQNTTNQSVRSIQEYSISYDKAIGNHKFNVLLLNSYETQDNDWRRLRGTDLSSNDTPTFDNAASFAIQQNKSSLRTYSYLGRLRYSFDSRYLLTAVLRRDASSRFGPQNRVGWFPSVSVGWNVSEEKFFEPIKDVVNEFKIRYGYGQTGSDRIPDYAFSPVVISGADYVVGGGSNENLITGLSQPGFADPSIKWETNISNNIGVDMQFLEGKINLTVDVYQQEKRDMLLQVATSVSDGAWGGFDRIVQNVGNMENRGIEIAAGYREQFGKLKLGFSGTFTKNENEVISMARGETIFGGNPNIVRASQTDPATVYRAGLPAGAFFLIPTDGTIKTQEELLAYQANLTGAIGAGAQVGDLRYIDTNGDGVINNDDRVFQGSGNPDFEFGFNVNAQYGGFDLAVQLYGVQGAEVYNGPKNYAYSTKRHRDLVYAWSDANPTSNIPTPRTEIEHPNVRTFSDYFLEDGSFLRVRNIVLGYTLPSSLIGRWGISQARFYASAQNAFTFTNYEGFDPEVASNNPLNNGIDTGKYPVSAIYRLGLQFNF